MMLFYIGCSGEEQDPPDSQTDPHFVLENNDSDEEQDSPHSQTTSRFARGKNDSAKAETSQFAVELNENKLVCLHTDNSIEIEYELVAGPVFCTHPSQSSSDQCDCELRESKRGRFVQVIAYSNAGTQSLHCLNRFNEIKNGQPANITDSKQYTDHIGLNCSHPETEDSWAKHNLDFLKENLKKAEVQSTASGLQYKMIREGTGRNPSASSTMNIHYTTKLITGETVDSSIDRGNPLAIRLDGVIPGLEEGLQLMKEGAVYEFYIPSRLAYGTTGAGGSIRASTTVIFYVELIEILD